MTQGLPWGLLTVIINLLNGNNFLLPMILNSVTTSNLFIAMICDLSCEKGPSNVCRQCRFSQPAHLHSLIRKLQCLQINH